MHNLKKYFTEYDRNKDDMLNLAEFTELMIESDLEKDQAKIEGCFIKADLDKDSQLNWDEFQLYFWKLYGILQRRKACEIVRDIY